MGGSLSDPHEVLVNAQVWRGVGGEAVSRPASMLGGGGIRRTLFQPRQDSSHEQGRTGLSALLATVGS